MEVMLTESAEGDVVGVATADGQLGGEPGELLAAEGFEPRAGEATLLHVDGRRLAVAGLMLGGYDPGRWKSADGGRAEFERLAFAGPQSVLEPARRAATVAAWVNRARDLANEPPNELTPAALAGRTKEFAAGSEHLTAESGGPERLAELGMGSFGAVAQGSHNPAQLIVLRYDPPGARDDLVLGLVGKAVTFDTGGISIKPALYMEDMKGDMAGGGAVLAGMGAIAEL